MEINCAPMYGGFVAGNQMEVLRSCSIAQHLDFVHKCSAICSV